jgi:hypothetical protein
MKFVVSGCGCLQRSRSKGLVDDGELWNHTVNENHHRSSGSRLPQATKKFDSSMINSIFCNK